MKETAKKVVDLQRQVLRLRQQLKQKEDVEEMNQKLFEQVSEYKAKYIEASRKHQKALDQVKELQRQLEFSNAQKQP